MRFSTLVTSASLLGAAVALPAVHQHREKRDAEAVVEAVNQDNVAAAAGAVVTTTTTVGAAAAAAATPAAAKAASTQAAKAAASSSSSSSSSSDSTEMTAVGVKGITYSPYNADGSCKSSSQVASDLQTLKDYPVIRLYGTDCDQVANVLQNKASSQKVFLGVYFIDQIQSSIDTMSAAIKQYGSWDDVVSVSIGNELVNSNQATPAQVGQYVATGRAALTAAGYTGKVVSVDTFISVINNPELCQYSCLLYTSRCV